MTYRQKYGKYEIRIDGSVWKWFKDYDKALAEYEWYAQFPEELDGDMELVEIATGAVLERTAAVE